MNEGAGEKRETVAGIVRKMHKLAEFNRTPFNDMPDEFKAGGWHTGEPVVTRKSVADTLDAYADRIEAAHAREVEVRAIIAGVSLADGECQRLLDENALLRKALEPILDYNTDLAAWDTYDARCQHAYDAIRKAQAIMKGEAK